MNPDSHCIRLSGKAEIEKPLPIGHNYKVVLEGSITAETTSDNDDGSKTHTFLFKPVLVETIDPKGERLRAKDIRSRSQQLRSLLWRKWKDTNEPIEFETWYDKEMLRIIEKEYEYKLQ